MYIWCYIWKFIGFYCKPVGNWNWPSKNEGYYWDANLENQKEVRRFFGRINLIGRFIAKLTTTYKPLFKLLRKSEPMIWNNDCQVAFEKIKTYLLNPPVLVPPVSGWPLIIYLAIHETSMGCVLGQDDKSGRKEQAIYYLSKKFTNYESRYSSLERPVMP